MITITPEVVYTLTLHNPSGYDKQNAPLTKTWSSILSGPLINTLFMCAWELRVIGFDYEKKTYTCYDIHKCNALSLNFF